jgi:TRAP-type mannitol/chloroaromatic compound transport system permease large subunit
LRSVFGFVGIELGTINPAFLQSLPLRMIGIMAERDPAGRAILHPDGPDSGAFWHGRGLCSTSIGQLFGPLRGGLALAVVLVGAMLAATTGVVAASVISMGLISMPIMLRYGYSREPGQRRDCRIGHAGADHPARHWC